jgi:2-keto-4-pentenoate hydratase/2-oxohepta-3-ene-1,7-dioic acid hydratase in catechol pathway
MKIICIGHNYNSLIDELGGEKPTEPIFFTKPDSAYLKKGQPFYYPDFTTNLHCEAEIVVKINRVGKNIQPKFASRYYNQIGVGIDFTAHDLHEKCVKEGRPWEIAKSFDGAAPIGDFYNVDELGDIENIKIRLDKNGNTVQNGSLSDQIFSIDEIISYVSRYFTLKIGDLIFTGTPAGVGSVKIGDKLSLYLNDKKSLDLQIR